MAAILPKPLAEYFAAANTDDAVRVAACFAEDALVHDEGRDISGKAAIRSWAEETRRKYRFQSEPLSIEQSEDRTIVIAHLTGDFPGSPINLSYRFKLKGAQIVALEIG